MVTRSSTVLSDQALRTGVPKRLFVVVLASALLTLATRSYLDEREVIGGSRFRALTRDRALISLVAVQKAELNQAWGELGSIAGQNAESVRVTRERVAILLPDIDRRFGELLSLEPSEERRLAIEDARATWTLLVAAFLEPNAPAIGSLHMDTVTSRRILRGTRRRLFERVNEQVTSFLELIRGETEQRESAAVLLIRRLTAVNLAAQGLVCALLLIALWRSALSLECLERNSRLFAGPDRHSS